MTRPDRRGSRIELTDERWFHIVTYYPELEDCREDVLDMIRKGRRRQDAMEPEKYKYIKRFDNLSMGCTYLVVVVKMIHNNFILTAYGIEKKERK